MGLPPLLEASTKNKLSLLGYQLKNQDTEVDLIYELKE